MRFLLFVAGLIAVGYFGFKVGLTNSGSSSILLGVAYTMLFALAEQVWENRNNKENR